MSMPIGFASKVSFASMRRRWVRTILALFPCVLLIAVLFVGSTIPNGLVNELDDKILQTAEGRQELVHLNSYFFTPQGTNPGSMSEGFNKKQYDIATKATQVKEVYPQYGNLQVYAPSFGNLKSLSLNILGNNQEFAKLYTGESFVYEEGRAIPLIVNTSGIASESYNFGSSDTIRGDYSKPKSFEGKVEYSALKDADRLVGKTIKMNVNQFSVQPGVIEEFNSSGSDVTLKKVTDLEKAGIKENQKAKFGVYWDLDKLRQPLNVEFKIVGLIRDQSGGTAQAYIPNDAAVDLFNRQYQLQKSARTTQSIPSDFYSSQESRADLKDGKLSFVNSGYMPSQFKLSKDSQESLSTAMIPTFVSGLVAEQAKTDLGLRYQEPSLKTITSSKFNPTGAVVRLGSADDRDAYIKFLKQNSMELYDNSPLSVIKLVRKWSGTVVTWLTIILGTITSLILLTTMGRFVADSRREIGVWRAIGATKLDIKKLVWVRMAWLLVIAIGSGIIIGLGISYILANSIASSVNQAGSNFNPYASQNLVASMVVSFLGGEVPQLSKLSLMSTDWVLLLSRLALLSLISMFLCLLPARKASRISPVIAIRDNE